ncbi:hypothetical protein BH23BAC4_BH23BAC4_14400 [soil metagenome]
MRLALFLLLLAPAASAQVAGEVELLPIEPAPNPSQEPTVNGGILPEGVIIRALVYGGVETQPFNVGAVISLVSEFRTLALSLGYSEAGPMIFHGSVQRAVSIAAGAHTRIGGIRLSALGGPAIMWGLDAAPRPDETFVTVGAVLESSILMVLSRHADLGLRTHATFNSTFVSAGVGPVLRVKLSGP